MCLIFNYAFTQKSCPRCHGWYRALLLSFTILLSSHSGAEVVKNLFDESILVATQHAEEREAALGKALRTVIVRASGNPSVLEAEAVQRALTAPQQYLESFHYQSTDEQIDYQGVPVSASRLMLKFSERTVVDLLRKNSLTLWPSVRPSLLIWMVKDDVQHGRSFQQLQGHGDAAIMVADAMKRRGLPMVVPALDLQDQLTLSVNQVWQFNMQAVQEASQRYSVDAILVGRYSVTSSGRWLSTWSLIDGVRQEVFESHGDSEREVINGAIDQVASYFADSYSVHLGGETSGQLVMELQGLSGFQDYVNALSYLDALTIVRRVELVAMQSTTLRVVLHTEESVDRLLGTFDLGKKLMALPVSSVSEGSLGSQDNPLRYRWP